MDKTQRSELFQLDYKFPHVKMNLNAMLIKELFQLDYKFPHVKIGAGGSLVLQGFQDVLNLKK